MTGDVIMRKLFEILYRGFLTFALFCFSVSAMFLIGVKLKTTSFKDYDVASALITDVSDVTKDIVFAGPIYYQDVTVTYQIDDTMHTTTIDNVELQPIEKCYSVGDNLPIYVNKKDPTDVSLEILMVIKSKSFGILMLRLAMQLLLVSAVAWAVFKSLGGKKERKEDVTERK